jgi:hypothetical protein
MAVWMIQIRPGQNPGDPARFVPSPLQQPGPNGEAFADTGDLVNWFNFTEETYQPEATDSNFQPLNAAPGSAYYLSEPIRTNQASMSSWRALKPNSGDVLYYRCALHHEVHGMIIIS